MIKETSRLFLQRKEEFMKKYIPILKRTQLFAGVTDDEISSMLNCLGAKLHTYKKGEYVFRQGEHIEHITILVEGDLHIQRDDYWGNRSIINRVGVGEMFGEAYAAPESGALLPIPLSVINSAIHIVNAEPAVNIAIEPTAKPTRFTSGIIAPRAVFNK